MRKMKQNSGQVSSEYIILLSVIGGFIVALSFFVPGGFFTKLNMIFSEELRL